MYYDMDSNPIEREEWGKLFETADRVIGKFYTGEVEVSTVWLGINHNFMVEPPLIYETMIFGGEHDLWMERYSTKEQAVAGHKRAVKMVLGE